MCFNRHLKRPERRRDSPGRCMMPRHKAGTEAEGHTAAPAARPSARQCAQRNSTSFVYVIGTTTPRGCTTYVGWTLDPERRLAQHNTGAGAKSTRGRQWQLLYIEKFETRADAMSREWHLKRDRQFRRQLALLHLQEANGVIHHAQSS